MYKKLVIILACTSVAYIHSMEKTSSKPIISSYQLPEGVSDNYLTVIHTALDNVGEPGSKPDHCKSLGEKVLENPYISHCISQYIPTPVIDYHQRICAISIDINNYLMFKQSLEMLKIFNAKFSDLVEDHNYIETYEEFNSERCPSYPHAYKECLLNLACSIDPRRGMMHKFHQIDDNLPESEKSKIAIIQELIKNKVNLNGKNSFGETAIHTIINIIHASHAKTKYIKCHREECITIAPMTLNYEKKHYSEILKLLIDAGANIDEESFNIDDVPSDSKIDTPSHCCTIS